MEGKNRTPNHLINETSPYLLAHAHNPVDWYPWGEEAFTKAKGENKLIFLSIGYHACHWCHVMERESFEDQDVADLLNESYICIKVDREERKDLDAIYMKACQAITGTGGWPMNLWLTPDKLPVYAGTYFPKNTYMNRMGLIEVATFLKNQFLENPQAIFNKSFDIITHLKRAENHVEASLDPSIVENTYKDFETSFDPIYGGFSKAPKFPTPHQLMFLLESDKENHVKMALKTLEQMAKGGIYDHIGGGFSRYSVDEAWLIPHFEKMLYDNGLLLDGYCKAYEITQNESYRIIVMEIKEFLCNELQHSKGGFYSAYDADSEGVEGKYYRFSQEEIFSVLNKEEATAFCKLYDVTEKGNFEGFNIPNLIKGELRTINNLVIKEIKEKLYQYRNKRVKPALDDKILSMCNGFAIHGLARIYEVFDDAKALQMAEDTANYLIKFMMKEDGLLASVRQDKGNIPGMIDDYAATIRGFFQLYRVTQKESYYTKAMLLMDQAINKFYDKEHGGFFVGDRFNKGLIYNPKEIYDGATPSGNSLMAMNLLKGFLLSDDLKYKTLLEEMVHCFSHQLNRYKMYASYFIRVIKLVEEGTKELKIYFPTEKEKAGIIPRELKTQLGTAFTVMAVRVNKELCLNNKPTMYLCENGTCKMPIEYTNCTK